MNKPILMIFCLFLAAGCGSQEGEKELILLCGSSFVTPTEELSKAFFEETGITLTSSVAGSEDFLPLVKAGMKGDILVTHDPYLDYVRDAGALAEHAEVGHLAPVLAVQTGNPMELSSMEDLTRPGLRVALSNPAYSTCGEMVFALLEKKGIKEKVMKNVENRLTKGHSQLGTLLKTKTVDAVIMWNGVAHCFRDDLDTVRLPYEYDEEIRVHIMGLNYSKKPDLVKQFIAFASERGSEIFGKHGYVK